MKIKELTSVLSALEIEPVNYGACDGENWFGSGKEIESISPINGQPIAKVVQATQEDYEKVITNAQKAFLEWRDVPAPKRGEIVRLLGDELRQKEEPLGQLVTIEMGR